MASPIRILLVAAIAGGALAATAAGGSAAVQFKTPSANIGCYGTSTDVRCDIRRSTGTRPPKPRTCRFDWGTAFGLTRTGRGRGLCVSDTTLPYPGQTGVRTLKYGRSIRVNARIVCTSRRTGLTCRNTAGHGFFLSKSRIRLY